MSPIIASPLSDTEQPVLLIHSQAVVIADPDPRALNSRNDPPARRRVEFVARAQRSRQPHSDQRTQSTRHAISSAGRYLSLAHREAEVGAAGAVPQAVSWRKVGVRVAHRVSPWHTFAVYHGARSLRRCVANRHLLRRRCVPCVALLWIGGTDFPQYRWKHTPDRPELQLQAHGDAGRPTSVSARPPRGDWLDSRPTMPALCQRLMRRSKQPSYSITSSARASSSGGTSRPSVLAVLRLTVSLNLVGVCTGKSAGFSPLRMRST